MHGIIDPRLGPLSDNGGPTWTHALLPASPAINQGNVSALPGIEEVARFDQRNAPYSRVVDGRIDIGAFEFGETGIRRFRFDDLIKNPGIG